MPLTSAPNQPPIEAEPHGASHVSSAPAVRQGGLNRATRPITALDPALAAWDTRTLPELLHYALAIGDSLGFAVHGNHCSGTWGEVLRAHPLMAAAEGGGTADEDLPAEVAALAQAMRIEPQKTGELLAEAEALALREYALQQKQRRYANTPYLPNPAPVFVMARADPARAAGVVERLALEQGIARDHLRAWQQPPEQLLPQPDKRMTPHVALLAAFLQLLQKAQNKVNQIPAQHLHYFFREYLGLAPAPAKADSVVLLCAVPEGPALLPPGHLFGGEDPDGTPLTFSLTRQTPVSPAALKRVISLNPVHGGAPWTEVREWRTLEADNGVTPWQPFDSRQDQRLPTALLLPLGCLRLGGGERRIFLTLVFETPCGAGTPNAPDKPPDANTASAPYPPPELVVELSGAAGWIAPAVQRCGFSRRGAQLLLHLDLFLDESAPPVAPGEATPDEPPFLRLQPAGTDPEGEPQTQWWRALSHWHLAAVEAAVRVDNLRPDALLANGETMSPDGPAAPFGIPPVSGGGLEILCDELRHHPLETVSLHWQWPAMPECFARHFRAYPDFSPITTQGAVHAGGTWLSTGKNTVLAGRGSTCITILEGEEQPVCCADGRCRVTLTASGSLFGHNDYQRLLIQATHIEASLLRRLWRWITGKGPHLKDVNPPLQPLWDSLRLTYKSRTVVRGEHLRLLHTHPTGMAARIAPAPLWPVFEHRELLLGLENVAGGALSLYVRLGPQPWHRTASEAAPPLCFMLRNGTWHSLSLCPPEYGGDGTNGLRRSGILTLSLPSPEERNDGQEMQPLSWIKLLWPEEEASRSILGLHPHAGLAVRASLTGSSPQPGEAPARPYWPLPAGCIIEAVSPQPELASVLQPYPSEGGMPPEDEAMFLQRSAEFLRHRGRAITAWDYERLTLERFSEIQAVRCVPHTVLDAQGRAVEAPGHLTVVIFAPGADALSAFHPPAPAEGLVAETAAFLRSVAPPFAHICVRGPWYEPVHCHIRATLAPYQRPDEVKKMTQALLASLLAEWTTTPDAVAFASPLPRHTCVRIAEQPFFRHVHTCRIATATCTLSLVAHGKPQPAQPENLAPAGPASLFYPGGLHCDFQEET